jgi:hypothetical protein
VQSSRERLGTLGWFLALRYLFLRDWISVFPPALQNSQARFCALETVLWFFRKISLYSLLNFESFCSSESVCYYSVQSSQERLGAVLMAFLMMGALAMFAEQTLV